MAKERLRGTTLKVYLLLVGRKRGVREIQKALGLSSPSVVHYHLTKLQEMGLVEQDQYGRYTAKGGLDASHIGPFVLLAGRVIPRYAFYATFFTTFPLSYLYFLGLEPMLFFISWLAAGIFWFETFMQLRGLMK